MSRHVVVWLTLTLAAVAVLLAWVLPDMIVHRGQIYAIGTEVVVCTGGHPNTGRAQVLHHLADCAGDNTEVRRELRDELSAIVLAALAIGGIWRLTHRPEQR